jgi:hypothetical protein
MVMLESISQPYCRLRAIYRFERHKTSPHNLANQLSPTFPKANLSFYSIVANNENAFLYYSSFFKTHRIKFFCTTIVGYNPLTFLHASGFYFIS